MPGNLKLHNSRSENSNIEFTFLLLYNRGTKWIRFSRLKILELNKKYPHLSRKRSIRLCIGVPPLPQEYTHMASGKAILFPDFPSKPKNFERHRTMTAQQSSLIAWLYGWDVKLKEGIFGPRKLFKLNFNRDKKPSACIGIFKYSLLPASFVCTCNIT